MLQNSSLEITLITCANYANLKELPKEVSFKIKVSEKQARELATYLNTLPADAILFGLRFAYNRKSAEDGGYLLPGRKSMVKSETHSLSQDQARWRLENWKGMIKSYREKGYSYPTISRIKKEVKKMAGQK